MAQKAYLHLIKWALKKDFTINVFDGEEWFRNCGYKQAKDAIEAVDDQCAIRLFKDGKYKGWAAVLLEYNQPADESVYDYSDNATMNEWCDQYLAEHPEI